MNPSLKRLMAIGMSLTACAVLANNVVVTNATLDPKSPPVPGTVKVKFDLSWNNSWRDGVNYDACWVFVKYSTDDAGTNWSHATLAGSGTNPAGFYMGTGTNLDIVVPSDKKGAFIQRSGLGTGTVANTGVTLVWDYNTNGVLKSQSARVQVFAIEMVYVPTGAFYVGDGTNDNGQLYQGGGTSPYYITNEAAIPCSNQVGCLWGASQSGNNSMGGAGWVSNAFPKGYGAFYLMKTEISQRQYCDFLNTLTAQQQANRVDAGLHFSGNRNFIKMTSGSPAVFGCDANGNAGPPTAVTNVALLNETNDAGWVACNYLSWMDGAAYAEWAALRPMTEMEFEKACRGPLAAVAGEYAWGNTNLEALTTSLNNLNTASETPNQGNCNVTGSYGSGPYRCGSYATASSSRQDAGAGYYGALDLSGNLWEWAVSLSGGRGFAGTVGNGSLSGSGNAHEADWPGWSAGEVTGATGAGFRGGDWLDSSAYARVSDRGVAAIVVANRNYHCGWRAVRLAP